MKRYINLMPDGSKRRQCVRLCLLRWLKTLGATCALLVVLAALTTWPCYRLGQQRANLELRYEPTHQLKAANRTLEKKIAQIQLEEKLVLGLAKKTPVTTLLGIVGQSVRDSQGNIVVEQLEFRKPQVVDSSEPANTRLLAVEGVARDNHAIEKFTELLGASLPFLSVQVSSTTEATMNEQAVQSFSLDCTF